MGQTANRGKNLGKSSVVYANFKTKKTVKINTENTSVLKKVFKKLRFYCIVLGDWTGESDHSGEEDPEESILFQRGEEPDWRWGWR